MFPNSLEREKLKHSLGGVLCHSVVSRGSSVVFGSDNTLLLAGFMLTRGVPAAASTGGSCPASPGRGQSPRPGHGSPPSGCSLQTAAQLPGSVFPTSGTNSLTTDTTNPINRAPLRALPKPLGELGTPGTAPAGVTLCCPSQVGHGGRIHQQHSGPGMAGWKRDHYML